MSDSPFTITPVPIPNPYNPYLDHMDYNVFPIAENVVILSQGHPAQPITKILVVDKTSCKGIQIEFKTESAEVDPPAQE